MAVAFAFLGGAVGYAVAHQAGAPRADSIDVGFYQDMISHHEQALQMATVELASGSDSTIRSLAREILQAQSYEIGLMRQQLTNWGLASFDRPDTAMAWMGHEVVVDEMPGLATPEQMRELRESEGTATDELVLELMVAHHIGGVEMADHAADHAGATEVRDLAGVMARNQAIEVNEFRAEAERLGFDLDIPEVPGP